MAHEPMPDRQARWWSHCPPVWVPDDAIFFITINCKKRGEAPLYDPAVARQLFESMAFYHEEGRWGVELALVMPDHLHALISFSWDPGNGMMNLIRAWKRHTARHCGIAWQRDYFDHRIRSEEDHQSTWFYIRENPVRASLVANYEEWPHVWRPGHGRGWR